MAYDIHVPERILGELTDATASGDLLSAAADLVLQAAQHLTTRQTQIRFGCLASEHLVGRERIDASLEQLRATPNFEQFILKFISNAIAGKSLPVYGDSSNVREWIYVADNCRWVDPVCRKDDIDEIYTIGSHAEKTNIEVIEAILDADGTDGCHTLCNNRSH